MARLLLVHAAPIEARDLAASLRAERILEIGVGAPRAAMNLTRALLLGPPPDLVIAFGVCGAYPARLSTSNSVLSVRSLCVVTRETFADEGVATDAGFITLPDLGLAGDAVFHADEATSARLAASLSIPLVAGATVTTCSGSDARGQEIAARSGAAVETMEGAAIALVCARFGLPWIQLRAVSNWCGDRARGAWDLDGALEALHAALPLAVSAV